jgi:queuine tRNA-ribosyltransferase
MGVGTPDDIIHAVRHGIDMFDCVLPTRDARHGRVYRRISDFRFQISNSDPWYETINIGNEQWKDVDEPIDRRCACPTCQHHTLAYLRHLTAIGEPLGARLATLHNLSFYLNLMRELRAQIVVG